MIKLVVASKNAGKIREFTQMFQKLPFEILSLSNFHDIEEPEETGLTFMQNAQLKARYYADATGELCMADDSGLEVYSLNSAPGVLSARYAGTHGSDSDNNNLLLANMLNKQERGCRFFCALAVAQPDGHVLFETEGFCEGELLYAEKGQGGFGYDPLFFSLDLKKSLAEATPSEKNSVSHRSRALKKLVKKMGEAYADRIDR